MQTGRDHHWLELVKKRLDGRFEGNLDRDHEGTADLVWETERGLEVGMRLVHEEMNGWWNRSKGQVGEVIRNIFKLQFYCGFTFIQSQASDLQTLFRNESLLYRLALQGWDFMFVKLLASAEVIS